LLLCSNAAAAVQGAGGGTHHSTNVWASGEKDGASNQHARTAVMLTALPFAGAAMFALWLGHRSQVGAAPTGLCSCTTQNEITPVGSQTDSCQE